MQVKTIQGQKEWSTDSWMNGMDKPWKHYAKWKKLDPTDYIVYDSIDVQCLEKANPQRQKVD